MGQIVTGLPNEVSINGSVPAPTPTAATNIKAISHVESTAVARTSTVPAGKIWYVVGFNVVVNGTASDNPTWTLNGMEFTRMYAASSSTYRPFNAQAVMFPYPAVVILAAGETAVFQTYGAGSVSGNLYYIQVDE